MKSGLELRSQKLNDNPDPPGGCSVLYVMSRDQRLRDNHALLFAQQTALQKQLPLEVVFWLKPCGGYRRLEHYRFMLKGLDEVARGLSEYNIGFRFLEGSDSVSSIIDYAKKREAAALVFDFSPLRFPTRLRQQVASGVSCPCWVVDTHNIVPVWLASSKQEVAARTLRPKVTRLLPDFLWEPPCLQKHPFSSTESNTGVANDISRQLAHVTALPIGGDYSPRFSPGETAAQHVFDDFLERNLSDYNQGRNDPNRSVLSNLSPYLHFGQIAALRVALAAQKKNREDAKPYLEELIVRKELSDNFCYYNPAYDSLEGAPSWARDSLDVHRSDRREYVYDLATLEHARTHDRAWNAAQTEMLHTGKMHGYMRMYWAKKLLEWTPDPETALRYGIYLNDTYNLDGNDPSGYVGLLWSIAGLHDRGWKERPVFGKIRYMNYQGLQRKFDVKRYERRWLTS